MNKIILASSSPRRKSLLKSAGYKFDVHPSNIDENIDIKDPHLFTKTLSKNKAEKVFEKFSDRIIISADTMVSMNNSLYGKPSNFEQAFEMISNFSGKTHKIITGVTILSNEIDVTESDEAMINLNKLSKEQIENFLRKSSPYDKAGAYSVEELPEDFIKEIKGEMTTILGLPMNIVNKYLVSLT